MCSEGKQCKGTGRGKLIIISGFSGAGKGTLVKKLMEMYPDQYALSVSATTRSPRPGEVEGVSYHYISQEEFDRLVTEDYFIEHAGYTDNSYGTPRPFVEDNLNAGRNVILEIELQGAMIVREKYPDVKMIFITTRDAKALESQLRGRNTEAEEKILKRLAAAVRESADVKQYQHLIINEVIEDAAEEIHQVICQEKADGISEEKLQLIEKLRDDLKVRLGL